jgi:hypothetical protein
MYIVDSMLEARLELRQEAPQLYISSEDELNFVVFLEFGIFCGCVSV